MGNSGAFGKLTFGRFHILNTDDVIEYGNDGEPLALVSSHFSSVPSYLRSLSRCHSLIGGVADVCAVSCTVLLSGLNLRSHPAQELALSRHMFIH